MAKTYTFQDPYYTIEVPVTTAVAALAIPYCVYHAVKGDLLTPVLLVFFIVAAVYQVWNVVVARAFPKSVTIDDDSISFTLFNKTERYEFADITSFKARSNGRSGRIFLRINEPTPFKGRYWMGTNDFTDGQELFFAIDELECKIHPDGLKAKSRRNAGTLASPEEKDPEKRVSNKDRKKRGGKARAAAVGTKSNKSTKSNESKE